MTKLTKPVTRETAILDRGVPLIATLYPRHLEIRLKGTRQKWIISYDACMWLAIHREVEEKKREKAKQRRNK